MEKSEQINELATALAKAQAKMRNAKKSSDNPSCKSKYADLAEVLDTCRESLCENGLSIAQPVGAVKDNAVELTTILMHSSGQWISSTMNFKLTRTDPQAIGSCISYMRRYGLCAMVGIAQADDDAESATVHNEKPATVQQAEQAFRSNAQPVYVKKDKQYGTMVLWDNGKYYALEALEKQGKLDSLKTLANDSRYAPCHDEIRTMMARMREKK